MIIAYYPGGGGNRYKRMLQGLEWTETNRAYDNLGHWQEKTNKYLLDDDCTASPQNIILTHCLNESHIKKAFPNHEIIFIIGNVKTCLQREWALAGHVRYLQKEKLDNLDRINHYNAFKDQVWPVCLTIDDIDNLPIEILTEINQDFNKIQLTSKPLGPLEELQKSIVSKVNSAFEMIQWHKDYYEKYPLSFSNKSTIIDVALGSDNFSKIMQKELELYNNDIFNEVWNKLNG
jgi:hypothetical protein